MSKAIKPHIPHAHQIHRNKCGCWIGGPESKIVCPYCGAAYLWEEVVKFPIWTCEDCGAILIIDKIAIPYIPQEWINFLMSI